MRGQQRHRMRAWQGRLAWKMVRCMGKRCLSPVFAHFAQHHSLVRVVWLFTRAVPATDNSTGFNNTPLGRCWFIQHTGQQVGVNLHWNFVRLKLFLGRLRTCSNTVHTCDAVSYATINSMHRGTWPWQSMATIDHQTTEWLINVHSCTPCRRIG